MYRLFCWLVFLPCLAIAPAQAGQVVVTPLVQTNTVFVPIVVPATTFQFVPAAASVALTANSIAPAAQQVAPVQVAQPVQIAQPVQVAQPVQGIAQAVAPGTGLSATVESGGPPDAVEAPRLTKSGLIVAPGDDGPPASVPKIVAPAEPLPGPETPSPAGSSSLGGLTTGGGTFLQVLTTRCASCHTGASSSGDFVLFTGPGQLSPAARDRFKLSYAAFLAEVAAMPPKAKNDIKSPHSLPDREVQILKSEVLRLRKAGR